MSNLNNFEHFSKQYLNGLNKVFDEEVIKGIDKLSQRLFECWQKKKSIYLCGNGGSAANAIHIANDLHYGAGMHSRENLGLRVEALTANTGILTCLANDTGYENIFANQLRVNGDKGDHLIILSGSGNSQNIVNALKEARKLQMKSTAIVSFDGGISKEIADECIHTKINDMQIAEDVQLIIGHICMQWLQKVSKDI